MKDTVSTSKGVDTNDNRFAKSEYTETYRRRNL